MDFHSIATSVSRMVSLLMGRVKKQQQRSREGGGSPKNATGEEFCSGHEIEFFLPQEIIFEILSKLPVRTLLMCKCVCKSWFAIIEDRKFIEKHMDQSKVITETTTPEDGEFRRIIVKDGLAVERSNITKKYRVINPATKESLNLPDPFDSLTKLTMFFVPTINKYKLLYTYKVRGTIHGGCQVLTVGTDVMWRTIDIPWLYDLELKKVRVICDGTNDMLFLSRICDAGHGISEIVCIEAESEQCVNMEIPQVFFPSRTEVEPFLWEDKLSLGGIVNEELHIWILEDHKTQKWAETKTVISLSFLKQCPNFIGKHLPFLGYNGWLFFVYNEEHYIVYGMKTKKMKIIKRPPPEKRYLSGLKHTLVKLEGISPKDKAKRQSQKFSLQQFCRTAICFKE